MEKNCTKAMGRAAVMSLILAASLSTTSVKASAGQVTRTGGADSYETAAIVATTNWTNPKDVVLVCGEGYADAVSASVLAKQLDAPILLTTATSLNTNAKNALDKLRPQNIYVIGGNASVSQAVRNDLRNNSYNLIELGGKDRYETNVAVANQLIKLGGNADSVILVSGEGFSDILSATPIAAAKGQIILLGNNDSNSMKPVIDFINANNSKVTVVGTTYSINDNIYKTVGATSRVSGGTDRFETNLNVLNSFNNDLKSDKLFVANASRDRYADALIASSLAGKWNAPLVLVDDENASATNKAIDYVKGKISSSTDLNVIGGTTAVSDGVVSKINGSVSKANIPTVQSVTAIGLNQIKVVFNTDVDRDSAQLLSNYKINGASLGSGSATLQDDNRTILITLSNPMPQYNSVLFMVGDSILDKTGNNNIVKFQQNITFSDLTGPNLESVTARGGNKLIIKFSEPIRVSSGDLSAMKINRQSVSNYGLNTSLTTFGDQSGVWSDRLELYFDSPLPVGSNTFVMPTGETGTRFDSAGGFPVAGTSITFNVQADTGTPQVTNVTCDNTGAIYVTYDRSMDEQTALEDSNYSLNGNILSVGSSNINFVEGSDDKIVKIEGLNNLLKNGQNQIVISDNVKDTYGYTINQSTFNFNNDIGNFKPQVTNVSILDSTTIRIKFSKEVLVSYATSKSNYKILDSDGQDITYKVNSIQSVYNGSGNNYRTFDIKFNDPDALNGTKYTLTVKNIIDTVSPANTMDTYTTDITGLNSESPKVLEIVKTVGNDQEAIIFFNKAMDSFSVTDYRNYYFVDGNGNTKNIPSGTSLSLGPDNKSVIIDFPSSYVISNYAGERYIKKIGVANVTDESGQRLGSIAYFGSVSTSSSSGPALIDNTAKLYFDGNDIKVRFSLTSPLDIINANDFKIAGKTPDTATITGTDVYLTFKAGVNNNEKTDAIKACGDSTTLNVSSGYSVDISGRKLRYGSDTVLIPPVTSSNAWTAYSNSGSGSNSSVTIAFNQSIDDDIASSYKDDFVFTNERTGERLDVLSVSVSGDDVIYNFNYGSIRYGDHIDVRANNDSSAINIRSIDHGTGDYSLYTPSSEDLRDRTLTAR